MTFALSFTPLWNRDERARYEPLASIDGALRGPLAATPDEPRSSIRDGEDEASAQLTSRMKAFLGGDERAFEALYRTLAPRVKGFLRGLSGDERTAEDLTQTTFLKVHRARQTYQLGAPVEPWIFAIARRTWLDHRRSRRRRPEDLSADGAVPEPPSREEAPEGFDRLDPAVAEALLAGLEALPEAQREAVVLLKVEGLSVADAALIAGVTPGALKVRAHRGYEALRRAIGLRRSP